MKKIVCAALLALMTTTAGTASQAQMLGLGLEKPNFTRPSTNFDVGVTFYKLIGKQPDFETWIKNDPRYASLAEDKKPAVMSAERGRLLALYNATDPKTTALVIRSAVTVQLTESMPDKPVLRIKFPPSSSIYFPYSVGNQTISVIPNGMDMYREIPLSLNEAAGIGRRLDVDGRATLVLEIVPSVADGSKPVTMDGLTQWLMLGEIGFLGIYNSTLQSLWTYQAANYSLKGQGSLLDLRDQGDTPK